MPHCVVDCLLNDPIKSDQSIRWKVIKTGTAIITKVIGDSRGCRPYAAFQECFHSLTKSEELQHRWLCIVDNDAQLTNAMLDIFMQGLKFAAPQS